MSSAPANSGMGNSIGELKFFFSLCIVVFFTGLFTYALAYDWPRIWQALRISNYWMVFHDLRATIAGAEIARHGQDPLVNFIGYDHPRAWIYLFEILGIHDRQAIAIALCSAAVFLSGIVILIWKSTSLLEAVLLFSSAFSAASLLAMHRGNTDQLMFVLVLMGVLWGRAVGFAVLVALASILKLFPLAALGAGLMFDNYRKECAVVLVMLGAFFLYNYNDLIKIKHHVSISADMSYGIISLKAFINYRIRPFLAPWKTISIDIYGLMLILLVLAAAMRAAWQAPPYHYGIADKEKDILQFLAFGLIYLGTFMAGSNWNYRLIFTIPLIPLFTRLWQANQGSKIPLLGMVCLMLALNDYVLGSWWGNRLGIAATIGLAYAVTFIATSLLKEPLRHCHHLFTTRILCTTATTG